jgi:hypothetical protein
MTKRQDHSNNQNMKEKIGGSRDRTKEKKERTDRENKKKRDDRKTRSIK